MIKHEHNRLIITCSLLVSTKCLKLIRYKAHSRKELVFWKREAKFLVIINRNISSMVFRACINLDGL